MNETPTSPRSPGRPRQELTSATKRLLERLSAHIVRCQDDLGSARAELAVAAREAHAEGASVSAIAEAAGLSAALADDPIALERALEASFSEGSVASWITQLSEAAQHTVESLRESGQAIDALSLVATGLRGGVSRFTTEAA